MLHVMVSKGKIFLNFARNKNQGNTMYINHLYYQGTIEKELGLAHFIYTTQQGLSFFQGK